MRFVRALNILKIAKELNIDINQYIPSTKLLILHSLFSLYHKFIYVIIRILEEE